MTAVDAIETCLRKYARFSGRAPRSEFWWFMLFCFGTGLCAQAMEWAINATTGTPDGPRILSGVAMLSLFIPNLAAYWRRLHDIGRSGKWFVILNFAAPIVSLFAMEIFFRLGGPEPIGLFLGLSGLIGSLVLLYWLMKPSISGANIYGPNPNGNIA